MKTRQVKTMLNIKTKCIKCGEMEFNEDLIKGVCEKCVLSEGVFSN